MLAKEIGLGDLVRMCHSPFRGWGPVPLVFSGKLDRFCVGGWRSVHSLSKKYRGSGLVTAKPSVELQWQLGFVLSWDRRQERMDWAQQKPRW